jgi:hypothetical protein
MPEFLRQAFADAPLSNPTDISIRLVTAVLLGMGVAWVYRATRDKGDVVATFPITLVLLAALIAMVTQVIGDNIARAFSLVGALSIVRFRTVVRDTQDTAFVIFAVVVGMAAGARDLVVAGIGIVVIGAAAFLMRPKTAARAAADSTPFVLTLRLGLGHEVEARVGSTLDEHLDGRRLLSMATAKQGLSIDVAYEGRIRKHGDEETLVKTLNRLEGVQSVELVRRTPLEN